MVSWNVTIVSLEAKNLIIFKILMIENLAYNNIVIYEH